MTDLNFADYLDNVEYYNKKFKITTKSLSESDSISAGYSLDSGDD